MSKRVRLLPSQIEFSVHNKQSILEAALSENINLEYSCSNGRCGSCKALLVQGDVKFDSYDDGISLAPNQVLMCASFPKTDLVLKADYIKELEGIERKKIPVKMDESQLINNDILIITFRIPPQTQFSYLPGQFINLMWRGQKRSYSLALSHVINNKLELHIKRVTGGVFSDFLFDDLLKNQLLTFYGPLGSFFVRESTAPIIFLCTGSGFAPVKAMIEALIESRSQRKIFIYWGGQYRKNLYSNLPVTWQNENLNISYQAVLSREPELTSNEARGYCQDEVVKQHGDLTDFHVYACGSNAMIIDSKNTLIMNGLNEYNFYSDAFLRSD